MFHCDKINNLERVTNIPIIFCGGKIWYNKDLPLIKIRKDDSPFRPNNPPHAYVPTMCRRFDEYGPRSVAAVYKQSQTSAQPVEVRPVTVSYVQ